MSSKNVQADKQETSTQVSSNNLLSLTPKLPTSNFQLLTFSKKGELPCYESMRGTSVFEALVASVIFLIVIAGMLPLIAMTLKGESSNDLYTQAANACRSKMEQIKNLSYVEIGLCQDTKNCPDPSPSFGPKPTGAVGMGYFEIDPYGDDSFTKNEDYPISDTVMLQLGARQIPAIRKVTVEAIDDAADGIKNADLDGLIDINTKAVIDYKLVTVTLVFIDPLIKKEVTQSLATIISGLGGDDDSNGNGKKPKGGVKPPPPPPSFGHGGTPPKPGGRKGRGPGSNWSSN